jgi:hypothetical protein
MNEGRLDPRELARDVVEYVSRREREGDHPDGLVETTDVIKRMGAFWHSAREHANLTRAQVLERMGGHEIPGAVYQSFEQGYRSVRDLPSRFLVDLTAALGDRNYLDTFIKQFGDVFFTDVLKNGLLDLGSDTIDDQL